MNKKARQLKMTKISPRHRKREVSRIREKLNQLRIRVLPQKKSFPGLFVNG